MAKKANNKKPTMQEVVGVINQVIQELTTLKTDVQTVTRVLEMYIEFNANAVDFNKFISNKITIKANNDVRTNEEGSAVAVEGSSED